MIFAIFLPLCRHPNTGANRSDKVLASEAPDKMLTKVIPTWIVDEIIWILQYF